MSLINRIAMVIMVAGSFSVGCCDAKAELESVASQPAAAYEWHTLVAAPGQLDAVHVRLRDGVLPALGNHGLRGVGVERAEASWIWNPPAAAAEGAAGVVAGAAAGTAGACRPA